tara:strand:+ start:961 stop:1830 length:870 start_codon:yes stop_codon:yes gene_type:complete
MSKIQIQELQSLTTDSNLKLIPNGTGVVKVSGDTDGTLQLDDVKVKGPSASAAQDYTLILSEDNVTADKYLKVDSITGSGSTAEGKLTYATLATPPASPLDGANFTSGTVPTARFTVGGSSGGGFQLVQYTNLTSSVSNIQWTGLEENTCYRLIGKNIYISNGNLRFEFLDAGNNVITGKGREWGWYGYAKSQFHNTYSSYFRPYNGTNQYFIDFTADICTGVYNQANNYQQKAYMHMWFNTENTGRGQYYFTFMDIYNQTRINGIKMQKAYDVLLSGTQTMLYKYQEA